MRGSKFVRSALLAATVALSLASAAYADGTESTASPAAPKPSRHFGFTKLAVADLDASAAFYEQAFQLVRTRRVDFEGGSELLYEPTAPGGAMFVLIHFADAPKPASGEVVLGFYTDDIAALVARVKAAGGAIDREPYAIPEMKLRVAMARDAEGHVLELLEHMP
jgi:predicted enzyme related to lactoylglutathione lyase